MERKEKSLIAVLLVTSIFATAMVLGYSWAATVTPSTPPSPTPQTTSVDIEVFNTVPGVNNRLFTGDIVLLTPCCSFNSIPQLSFSFAPVKSFDHVNRAEVMVVYNGALLPFNASAYEFDVTVIGGSVARVPASFGGNYTSSAFAVCCSGVRVGQNEMVAYLQQLNRSQPSALFIYEIRLSVEYTYLA